MISVGPAGRVIMRRYKTVNVTIFLETINVINVKICMVVLLSELCLFKPLSVTLTIFQCHWSVKQFQQKNLCSHPIKLKLHRIVNNVSMS